MVDDPLAELEALTQARRRNVGCVEKAIQSNPELEDIISRAVKHPTASGSVVAEFLRKHGVEISHQSISRHRRGDCSCRL